MELEITKMQLSDLEQIKEKLLEENKKEENFNAMNYLYHMLQSIDNVPEIQIHLEMFLLKKKKYKMKSRST